MACFVGVAAGDSLVGFPHISRRSDARYCMDGHGFTGYVAGTAVVLSLISLVTIWFGYAWAKRASGTPAAIVAALACSFFFGLVYFAPKALNEVVAAHVLLPGLYLGVYGEKLGERKRLLSRGISLRFGCVPAYSIAARASLCHDLLLLSALARREFPRWQPAQPCPFFSSAASIG